MKTLLGTAVVVAGLTFGAANAFANPAIGCGCTVVQANGSVATFNFPDLQQEDITQAENGNITAICKLDLVTTQKITFNNANTGFTCSITGSSGITPITPTTDWQEVISASGQTSLTCKFPPRGP